MKTKVAIIFDDGFTKSSLLTAELFEEFKLPACFAVLADPTVNFVPGCGDWKLWNELQSRGHIIHPHGYTHANMQQTPHDQAVQLIDRCLESFTENLQGFNAKNAIYNFAYNLSTPALIEYLLPRVRAIRTGGTGFLTNADLASRVWHSTTFGPEDPYEDFSLHLDQCEQNKPAAFYYCLHGIDGEYWGATKLDYLRRILERIICSNNLEYWHLNSFCS